MWLAEEIVSLMLFLWLLQKPPEKYIIRCCFMVLLGWGKHIFSMLLAILYTRRIHN